MCEKSEKRPVALVTGSSRGIGKGIVALFAENGYRVAVHYHSSQTEAERFCQELCEKYGEDAAVVVQADVSKEAEVKRMIAQVIDYFGEINVLVNNAGIAQQKLFTDITEEDWDRIFNTNVKGAFLCSREVLSQMIRRQTGNIINISSMWGITGGSCEVHYSASKAALIGMTKALAKELGPSHINVNCVAPGVIQTQMNEALGAETLEILRQETPLEMLGTARDIAEMVCFLASDKAKFITGQVISVDGGMVI